MLDGQKGQYWWRKKEGCCYLYMADPPPSHTILTCVVQKLQKFWLQLAHGVSLMNCKNEWSSLGIKGCPAFWIWAGVRRKKQAQSAKGSREECALKTNRLFAAFWPEQWLNGRYGGAAGVSAQPFSGRSVFVARLKEFVRLKGSWTGPGASMSYMLGVCEAGVQSATDLCGLKTRPWL